MVFLCKHARTHCTHPPVKRARSKLWRVQTRRHRRQKQCGQGQLHPKVFGIRPSEPKEEGDRLRGHLGSRKPWMLRCVLCFSALGALDEIVIQYVCLVLLSTIQRFYVFYATVHTNDVSRGNNVKNHNCWIFAKCQQKRTLRCIELYSVLFIDAIRDSARPCSRYSPTGHSASL